MGRFCWPCAVSLTVSSSLAQSKYDISFGTVTPPGLLSKGTRLVLYSPVPEIRDAATRRGLHHYVTTSRDARRRPYCTIGHHMPVPNVDGLPRPPLGQVVAIHFGILQYPPFNTGHHFTTLRRSDRGSHTNIPTTFRLRTCSILTCWRLISRMHLGGFPSFLRSAEGRTRFPQQPTHLWCTCHTWYL